MIKVENYSKVFRKGKGIFDVELTFEKGTVYGLIGPNGAGKTTLITALEGLYKSKGNITICDNTNCDNFTYNVSSMLEVTELLSINSKNIADVYESFCKDFNRERFERLLVEFGIDDLNVIPMRMSKGENLSLRIALALSRDTDIYIFDEPLAGIDVIRREAILNAIFDIYDVNEDAIVIISSHELHDIDKRIDELVFLNEGRIVLKQSLDQLKDTSELSLVELYKDILKN